MKASTVLVLQDWITEHKSWIRSEDNPTLKEIRIRAELDMGTKCPEGNIRQVMQYLEIPVRRSAADSKLHELEERCDQYRSVLLRIAAFVNLPDEIAKQVREEFNIDEELLGALRLKRNTVPAGR